VNAPEFDGGRVQPILESARLCLRPARLDDLDELWALWTDPDVRRFLWDDVAIDRDRALETINNFAGLAERGLGLWTIGRRDQTGWLIGCAAISPVDAAAQFNPELAGAVEPLIALAPCMWHQGYAIEALGKLLQYATLTLQIDRIAAVADAPNTASQRLLERAGFIFRAETDGPRYRLRHYRFEPKRSHHAR
jgi:RimJ/RimL family protein N-acetyltransferase